MLIRAGALIESANRVHRPGHLRMGKGKILAVGSNLVPLPGEEVLSIPEITLAPGWINLHAHLELSSLSGVLRKGNTFSGWLEELLPLLPTLTPEVRRSSILISTRHAAHSGTTSNFNSYASLVGSRIFRSQGKTKPYRDCGSGNLVDVTPPECRMEIGPFSTRPLHSFPISLPRTFGYGLSKSSPFHNPLG